MKTTLSSMNARKGKGTAPSVKMATLKNKNSISKTSSDPARKNTTKIGTKATAGVKHANIHSNQVKVKGAAVTKGGGSNASSKYSAADMSNGAMKTPKSANQPKVTFSKAAKANVVGKKSPIRKS